MTPLPTADSVLQFMLAGRATITLRSSKTGVHFTYKIKAAPSIKGDPHSEPSTDGPWFVSLLRGSNNETDYSYIGMLTPELSFLHTKASKVNPSASSFLAFSYATASLSRGRLPLHVEFYHEGRCGRCNRKLTDPLSIRAGLGPDCREPLGLDVPPLDPPSDLDLVL